MKKAIVAMSGGVDSSVAAFLMKEQGYECIGITMKLFQNDDVGLPRENTCCSSEDTEDARSVCCSLGIPYYVLNFTDRFHEAVIDRFVDAYEHGATPNPCIDCNRYLKFDALFTRAEALEADCVATGHYARITEDPISGRFLLKKAVDPDKDQSYVLYSLSQEQLQKTRFPLGGLTKQEARALASAHGFRNAKKHDSQDICFVPDGKYADFIERYTGKSYPPGPFLDREGNELGRHRGIIHYTIGQRKGLGIALSRPMYVCAIDPLNNTVTLASDGELYTDTLYAHSINLIAAPSIERPLRVKARIRYRQQEEDATVLQTDTDELKVVFDAPQRAVTRGQSVVLYDGDIVVGGGIIG